MILEKDEINWSFPTIIWSLLPISIVLKKFIKILVITTDVVTRVKNKDKLVFSFIILSQKKIFIKIILKNKNIILNMIILLIQKIIIFTLTIVLAKESLLIM
jgi:hypothetical protein